MPRLVTLYDLGHDFICEEGLCPYPKHGTFSFRSYSVPDDFKMNMDNYFLFSSIFYRGNISNKDGSIVHHPVKKKL